MHRREFLAALTVSPAIAARNRIDRARISAVTDEMGPTPKDAIQFAHRYGLKWLELRRVPGARIDYWMLPEPELKAAAREFREAGIGISFLNTPFWKFALPGTELVRKRNETPEAREKRLASEKTNFDKRLELVRQACRAAHIFGVDQMRAFAYGRVAEPEKIEEQVASVIGEMAETAGKEKIRLLLENEASCNVATSAELASLMKRVRSKWLGINWDPRNGMPLGEKPFPEGYSMLPKKRIGNVQIKGDSILTEKWRIDWATIIQTLHRDGYKGMIGLETHIFDGTMFEKSQVCIKEIIRMVES